jgi:prepilin-type N-terminal cleavage/methylation domain-containing protein
MRRGVTLVEMIVVLTLMGVLAGIGALAFGSLRRPAEDPWQVTLRRARDAAVDSGRAVVLPAGSAHGAVLLLPDGRAAGAAVNALTSEVADASR